MGGDAKHGTDVGLDVQRQWERGWGWGCGRGEYKGEKKGAFLFPFRFRAWLLCFHFRFHIIVGVESRFTHTNISHDRGRELLSDCGKISRSDAEEVSGSAVGGAMGILTRMLDRALIHPISRPHSLKHVAKSVLTDNRGSRPA